MVAQTKATAAGASVGAQKPPTYQPSDIPNDWTAILNIRRQFDQSVLLVIDQFYRQRDPTPAYLNVPGPDGTTNLATQITDPMLTFLHDKGKALNLSGATTFRCPADRNFAAPRNLGLCEDLIRYTFAINERLAPAHFSHAIIEDNIGLFGWAPLELHYETDSAKAQGMLGGFPVKLTLHNPMDVAYEHAPDGTLWRVIVGKRMTVGELPQEWRTGTLAGLDDYAEVTVHQDWNKWDFTALVDSNPVAAYPHNYVDLMGNPMIPFVLGLHDPIITRLGDAPPQLSYASPRILRVGRPPWMSLIGMLNYRSFLMTAQRYNIREFIAPYIKTTGHVEVDWQNNQVDIPDGVGTGDFDFIEPPNVLQNIQQGLQLTDELIQAGGTATNLLSGLANSAASGVSIQGQTNMARQVYEQIRATHGRVCADAGAMILAMIASNTEASEPRKFKAATGMDMHPTVAAQLVNQRPTSGIRQPPASGESATSAKVLNNGALPMYEWITGNVNVPIDDLTVAGVTTVECGITPYEGLPKETRMQMFMNLTQAEQQTGKKAIPDDMLYGEILGASNPQALIARIATDEVLGDPNRPFRKITALREIAQGRLAAENANTAEWTTLLTQLDQVEEQAYRSVFQQEMAQLAQGGGGQPPPGAAAPGGKPGEGPPQSGPPQGAGGPAPPPTQGPPVTPPQGPPPPNGLPGGGAMQGGPPTLPPAITAQGGSPPPGVM